jgi:FlaA1/EpsC-like NDP-sugar epimerase
MIFQGKSILVTGGTGSLGKVLVRRLLSGEKGTPKKVIVLSRDEGKQHDMRVSYLNRTVTTDEVIYRNFMNVLEFRIGNVRDYSTICSAIKNVDIVINAAALKQVPTCEYFPYEALLTNCLGPENIVRAIREHACGVKTVVGISTDKACMPVNLMGMTKAIQERIFINANILAPNTRFICTRYGNVMASRGSVIPLFHEQIKAGNEVTITDPKMTRFLLNLNQAVDLVFTAIAEAHAGEIYVPHAPSATIENMAKVLIGDRDIKLNIVGIRPGEKTHEIMISDMESLLVDKRDNYFAILPMLPELQKIKNKKSVLTKEYSSADIVMDLAETKDLLEKNNLLVDSNVQYAEGGELLR